MKDGNRGESRGKGSNTTGWREVRISGGPSKGRERMEKKAGEREEGKICP